MVKNEDQTSYLDQAAEIERLEALLERSRNEITTLSQLIVPTDKTSKPGLHTIVTLDAGTRKEMFEVMAMSVHLTRLPGIMRFGFMKRRHQQRLAAALRHHSLFDAKWYKQTYPEAAKSGLPADLYFVVHGIDEGHVPHPKFLPAGAV